MSSLLDGWNAGLARTFAWGKKVNDSMYTYNPKTAGKQIAATVSNGKAPQLKKKATVIPTNPQGSGNKEKLVKATVVNTPLVVDTKDDVRALQRSLGFKGKDVDGIVGPMTNAAAAKAGINLGITNADAFAPTPKQVIVKQSVVQKEKVQPQVIGPTAPIPQTAGKTVVAISPLESAMMKQGSNDASMNGGDYVPLTNAEKAALAQNQLPKGTGIDNGFGVKSPVVVPTIVQPAAVPTVNQPAKNVYADPDSVHFMSGSEYPELSAFDREVARLQARQGLAGILTK